MGMENYGMFWNCDSMAFTHGRVLRHCNSIFPLILASLAHRHSYVNGTVEQSNILFWKFSRYYFSRTKIPTFFQEKLYIGLMFLTDTQYVKLTNKIAKRIISALFGVSLIFLLLTPCGETWFCKRFFGSKWRDYICDR